MELKQFIVTTIRQYLNENKQSVKDGKILVEYSFPNTVIEELIELTKIYISKKGYPLSHIYQDKDNWRNGKDTNILKKEVGSPISTELIYSKSNIEIPKYVKWEIAEYGKDIINKITNLEVVKMPISKINISQEFVFEKPLTKIFPSNHFVPIFKFDNNYYLNDGNHYVASMFLSGQKYINTKIIEVTS